MITRLVVTFIAICAFNIGFAQQSWLESIQLPDSFNIGVQVIGEGTSNSNAITNAFFFGFMNGRFVTDDEKQKILDRSKGENRFGQDGIYGLKVWFQSKKDSSKLKAWNLSISERYHADGTITDEALELILYGNKRFAGQEINVDNTRLRYTRWKEFKWSGIYHLNNGWRVDAGAGFIWGDQNIDFSTDYARLYTSPLGDELRLNGTFNLNQSDTAAPGPHAFNGAGFGIDLAIQKAFIAKNANTGFIRFEVQDAGAIYWNENAVKYPGDTLYVYQGTEIDRILSLQDSEIDPLDPDSIWGLITPRAHNGNYHTLLPTTIQLSLYQDFLRYDVLVGASYRAFASYSPYFFTRVRYKTGNWRLGGNVGAGGYGTIQLGVEAAYANKGWQIMAGTRNLEGLALWQLTGGTSAFVSLAKFF